MSYMPYERDFCKNNQWQNIILMANEKVVYEMLELPVIYYQEEVVEDWKNGDKEKQVVVHRIITNGTIDPNEIECVTGSAGYTDKDRAMKMTCSRLWMKSGHAMEVDLPEHDVRQRWLASKLRNDRVKFIFKLS